jgi:hypothetical protein
MLFSGFCLIPYGFDNYLPVHVCFPLGAGQVKNFAHYILSEKYCPYTLSVCAATP